MLQLWRKPHSQLPGLREMLRPRQRLLSGRLPRAVRWLLRPSLQPPQRQNGRSRPPSRKVWVLAGTTLCVEAVSVKAAIQPPPKPAPAPVTESPRTEATTTRKGKTAKSAPKVTVGPNQAAVPRRRNRRSLVSFRNPVPRNWWPPTNATSHPSKRSPIS